MRRAKLGIVGRGAVATNDHLPSFADPYVSERAELSAVCDIAYDRARDAAGRYGAAEDWGSLTEMLAGTHAEVIEKCFVAARTGQARTVASNFPWRDGFAV